MLRLLLLLAAACCLFAAPHSENAALAELNQDVKALEMSLEQKQKDKKKKNPYGTGAPTNNELGWNPMWTGVNANDNGQGKHWEGFPSYDDWNKLRLFSAELYEKYDDGSTCGHASLGEFCEEIVASSNLETMTYDDTQVPWTIFKLKPGHFTNMGGVDCVIAFKGTDDKAKGDLYTDLTEVGSTRQKKWWKPERMRNAVANAFSVDHSSTCKTVVATGHSLGGCTALNAAVYAGVRAFTFAGPGPSRGGGNKIHPRAFDAIKSSATIYSNPDTIPFAGKHIGDWVCGQGGAPPPAPTGESTYGILSKTYQSGSANFETFENLIALNNRGAGKEGVLGPGLAGHSHVLDELIPPGDARSCFTDGSQHGNFEQITLKVKGVKGSGDVNNVETFPNLFTGTEIDPVVPDLNAE